MAFHGVIYKGSECCLWNRTQTYSIITYHWQPPQKQLPQLAKPEREREMLQLLCWAATHKFNSSSNLSKHKLHINLKMGNNKANISHSFIQIRIHYDSFMSLFNAFNCKWATKPTQVTSNDESISEIKKPNAEDNNKRPKECGHELSALLAWLVLVVSCFTCCSS